MDESRAALWSPSRLTQIASLALRLSSLALKSRARLPEMPQELRPLVSTDKTSRIASQQTERTFRANNIPTTNITFYYYYYYYYYSSFIIAPLQDCLLRSAVSPASVKHN